MKTFKKILPIALIVLSYYGCFSDVSSENDLQDQMSYNVSFGEETNKDLPTGIYYSVTYDRNRCAGSRCGGYWIKAINLSETVCPDGTIDDSMGCSVDGLDLNGLEISSDDIVLGQFTKKRNGHIFEDHFEVETAFSPVLSESLPYEQISLIQDSGLRCVNTRCMNSHQIADVNTGNPWNDYKYKFDTTEENQELLENAFNKAYTTGGALVQGYWKFVGTKRQQLKIINVYNRKNAQALTTYCTFMKQANKNLYKVWNVRTYEKGETILSGANFEEGTEDIVEGTCQDYPNSCTRIYRPVCGTNNVTGETRTYGNLCIFQVAIRQSAGDDAKATGKWEEGTCSN